MLIQKTNRAKGVIMKKGLKYFLILVTAIIVSLTAIACADDSGDTGGSNNDAAERPDYGTATVFAPGDKIQLITSSYDNGAAAVVDALSDIVGEGGVSVGSIYNVNKELEVLFNVTQADDSRPTIAAANRQLERFERPSE